MSNGIVLNHYSLPFNTKDEASEGLLIFFKVLKDCKKYGLKILLVDEDQDKSLMGLELFQGYFVRDWFNSSRNKPELLDWRRFLKNVETKQPLFEQVDISIIDEAIEVGLTGSRNPKPILLASYYFETFLASFAASEFWMKPHISVWVYKLGDPIEETTCKIPNPYNDDSLEIHGEELKKRHEDLTSSAMEIWENRRELFPHLIFLSRQIGTALQNWSACPDILNMAMQSLKIIEEFCEKWQASEYHEYRHDFLTELGLESKVSGESPSVRKNRKFRTERTYYLDDGRKVVFEYHVKLPNGYRLYYFPDTDQRIIHVAYLGPHKSTKKH